MRDGGDVTELLPAARAHGMVAGQSSAAGSHSRSTHFTHSSIDRSGRSAFAFAVAVGWSWSWTGPACVGGCASCVVDGEVMCGGVVRLLLGLEAITRRCSRRVYPSSESVTSGGI